MDVKCRSGLKRHHRFITLIYNQVSFPLRSAGVSLPSLSVGVQTVPGERPPAPPPHRGFRRREVFGCGSAAAQRQEADQVTDPHQMNRASVSTWEEGLTSVILSQEPLWEREVVQPAVGGGAQVVCEAALQSVLQPPSGPQTQGRMLQNVPKNV